MRAFSTTDFRGDLAAFAPPTLVVRGDADQTVPVGVTAKAAAAAIPDAALKIYEGAPHGLFLTHEDRLNADRVTFIRG